MTTLFEDPAQYLTEQMLQIEPDKSISATISANNQTWTTTQTTNQIPWYEVDPGHRVRYAAVVPTNTVPLFPSQLAKAMKSLHVQRTGGLVPIYFLPWKSNANVGITLAPQNQGVAADYFTTATLDGCAVFIEGTATQPIVYHLNAASVGGGMPDIHSSTQNAIDNVVNAKWQAMLNRFNSIRTGTGPALALNVTHYGLPTVDKDVTAKLQRAAHERFGIDPKRPPVMCTNRNLGVYCHPSRVNFKAFATVFGHRDKNSGVWSFFWQGQYVAIYWQLKDKCKGDKPAHWTEVHGWMPLLHARIHTKGLSNTVV